MRGKINDRGIEDRSGCSLMRGLHTRKPLNSIRTRDTSRRIRNVFLCNAMVNLYMIDTNSMGIPMMYQIQRDKCFPLPTYDLNTINRVKRHCVRKILDQELYSTFIFS